MDQIRVELTDDEYSRVSGMSCEQAAVEICRIHFTRLDPHATFAAPSKGADLRVRKRDGSEADIEVKGTEAVGVAWAKLKVSSPQSHDLLKTGMALYRVTSIGNRAVTIFVMRHGVDFEMVPEPRWSVRPARSK